MKINRNYFKWGYVLLLCLTFGPLIGQSGVITASHKSGNHQERFELELFVDDPSATIFYTIDGRNPEQHGIPYQGSISVHDRSQLPNTISLIPTNPIAPGDAYREAWLPPSGNVAKLYALRARALLSNQTWGPEFMAHYLVDESQSNRHNLPVVSVIVHPDDFFGYQRGIYVPGITGGNYYERGSDWERNAHWAFWDRDTALVSQHLGVRIHGGTSRNRPRKSLRFYAREKYGPSWLYYPLFPDKNTNKYKTFLMRNGGNDWSESLFRDAFIQRLMHGITTMDLQYARAAVLYINGEYWGIHHLRDRFDERYLEANHGLNPDSITILENRSVLSEGMPEGKLHYDSLFTFTTTQPINEPSKWVEVEKRMDVDNYIDYLCLQIFSRNTDWPGNNVAYWRNMAPFNSDSLHPGDGRWRWLPFDLDFGMGLNFDYVQQSGAAHGPNNAFHNTLKFALDPSGPSWPNPSWSTALFRSLIQNEGFVRRFVSRYADLLNTVFKSAYALQVLDSMEQGLRPEMDRHIARWNQPDRQRWENELKKMKDFLKIRPGVQMAQTDSEFALGGTDTIQCEIVGKGSIVVNSLRLEKGEKYYSDPIFPWKGVYFKNVPVRCIAIAAPGYRFSHWEGVPEGSTDTIWINIGEYNKIVAHFEEESLFEGDSLNPSAFRLLEGDYIFDQWEATRMEGEFPSNMRFLQSRVEDPRLATALTDPYYIPYTDENNNEYHANDQDKIGKVYALTGRTRIEALGQEGIAFINTGRKRDLGAAVLALDTRECDEVRVDWKAQTLQANSRVYHLRLQYRVGLQGEWADIIDSLGHPIDYPRDITGLVTDFGPIRLPADALNQSYVQLRWKYYFTGVRLDPEDGSRDKIRLDDIFVKRIGSTSVSEEASAGSLRPIVAPNPFGQDCQLCLTLTAPASPSIDFFSTDGILRKQFQSGPLSAGRHCITLDVADVKPGMYLIRITIPGRTEWLKVVRHP
jgi:hypothetical protein